MTRLPDGVNMPLLVLITFWILLWVALGGCSSTATTRVEIRERIDTLLVKGDTIRVREVQSDTIYVEEIPGGFRSVRAALDTTVQNVRMSVHYAYPPDRWNVRIMSRDTVIRWTVRDSIIQQPYEIQHVPLWVYIAMGGMALALVALLQRGKQ
jgi:hypothetical protein